MAKLRSLPGTIGVSQAEIWAMALHNDSQEKGWKSATKQLIDDRSNKKCLNYVKN